MRTLKLTTRRTQSVCSILLASSAASALIHLLKGQSSPCAIITDTNVAKLHGLSLKRSLAKAGIPVSLIVIPHGEQSKTLSVFSELSEKCFKLKLDRQSVIVALGGGVVSDLAGFVAATYMRGIRCINIPTTLLAMVDSSIGGKCGVNLSSGKNIIGAFHQPSQVIIDTSFLRTLPRRQMQNGMAEIVKYGMIADSNLFALLEKKAPHLSTSELRTVIARCITIKAQVVQHDERETRGLRQMLNYGHTFGHALESLTGFSLLSHGEAISIGMHLAAHCAVKRGLCGLRTLERQKRLLLRCELPIALQSNLKPARIIDAMARDKKSTSSAIRLILPTRIGKTIATSISRSELLSVLTHLHDPA